MLFGVIVSQKKLHIKMYKETDCTIIQIELKPIDRITILYNPNQAKIETATIGALNMTTIEITSSGQYHTPSINEKENKIEKNENIKSANRIIKYLLKRDN